MNKPRSSSKIYVRKADDIPQVEHFAIFDTSSYSTEASGEWAPGHGYPAATHNFVTYVAYTDEAEFLAELKERQAEHRFGAFRGVRVSAPYKFSTLVTPPPNVTIPVSTGLHYPRDPRDK